MKRELAALFAALTMSTAMVRAGSQADVLPAAVYRCTHADGQIEYTNVQQRSRPGVVCTTLFDYFATAPGRGLNGWRAFYADKNMGLLIYDERTRRNENVVEGWVMFSYSTPRTFPHTRTTYNRAVEKITADCDSHDLAATTVQARKIVGSDETLVGTLAAYKEEAAPGTIDDLVVTEMCKPPPKKHETVTTRKRT